MEFPSDLYYTREHEWVRVEDGVAVIGITDFAQGELGDIVYVEIEPAGTLVDAESVFGTVEAVKTVSELFAPVAGTIEEINSNLESAPESVNGDPYGEGWMVKIRMSDPDQVSHLLTAESYAEHVAV